MNRAEVLDNAKKCVCGQREQDYGTPEDNFSTIGYLWSAYLRAAHPKLNIALNEITPKDVAIMMSLLKVARIATGSSEDSFVDLAGYAACAGEIATRNTTRNENTCVCCGKSIPEGSQYCNECKKGEKING
nr:MAG TPA: PROTEIN/RNA Complex, archaeal, ribosomal, 50S, protein.0A [Caudoviricetes sp.]